jgi:hypothetical protein
MVVAFDFAFCIIASDLVGKPPAPRKGPKGTQGAQGIKSLVVS